MDAFGFRIVPITSEGKSFRAADPRGKHLRNDGPCSGPGDQLKPNFLFAAHEQPRAALTVAGGPIIRVGGTRAGREHANPRNPGADTPDFVATAASAETLPKPSRAERIELAIDSLQNYELIKPIPVLIESLGDKVFVAEAPDLNVSTTGNSVGAAFLLLKDHIITTYEGYRSKKGLDSERTRQLGIFDKYIGKTKRHWFRSRCRSNVGAFSRSLGSRPAVPAPGKARLLL
jgi:hypothetical protein